MLSAYVWTYLLIGISWLILALVVIQADSKRFLNRIFAIYCLTVPWWGIFSIPLILIKDSNIAVWWARVMIVGPIWIPTTFLHFIVSLLYLKGRSKLILRASYSISVLLTILAFTPWLIPSVSPKFGMNNYVNPSFLFHIQMSHFLIITITTFYFSFKQYNPTSELTSSRLHALGYLKWIWLIAYLGGTPNYFLIYGYSVPILPYSNLFTMVSGFMTTYAVFRGRFLDRDVIIRRTLVFAGLLAFVFGLFAALSVLGQTVLQKYIPVNSAVLAMITMAVMVFLYEPIRRGLVHVTNRFLFQEKVKYHELIQRFSEDCVSLIRLDQLVAAMVENFTKTMALEEAHIYVKEAQSNQLALSAEAGINRGLTPTVKAVDLPGGLEDGRLQHNTVVCNTTFNLMMPLTFRSKLIGVILLGHKKSGETFAFEELQALQALAPQLSLALHNAILFSEQTERDAMLAQASKMATIGIMTSSLNHEVRNPLYVAKGVLQSYLERKRRSQSSNQVIASDSEAISEAGIATSPPEADPRNDVEMLEDIAKTVELATKQIDRATEIMRRLSTFSKPGERKLESVNIAHAVDEVLFLLEYELKLNEIKITKDIDPQLPTLQADQRAIEEILFNLLMNAFHALEGRQNGRITIRATTVHRPQSAVHGQLTVDRGRNGDSIEITISDTGPGIAKDKQEKIFEPFYTTKGPERGTGLGLFVTKQLVEGLNGKITVTSEAGQGTMFKIIFNRET